MKTSYFQANLISINPINAICFTSVIFPHVPVFDLEKDGKVIEKLKIVRHTSTNEVSIYNFEMANDYEYGHSYVLVLEGLPRINIDVSEAVNFPGFDEQFYYNGNDLGAIYTKEETSFNLWAPTASKVVLKVEENKEFHYYLMERTDKGV